MLTTRFVRLGMAVCVIAVLAQTCSAQASKGPVAYVYLASQPAGSSVNQIEAYAAEPNGKLTPVPGSPFQENVYSMAVNGVYLMAASAITQTINAYTIQSNGSLIFKSSTNYGQYDTPGCGGAAAVVFDHTGSDLYVPQYNYDCANSGLASYVVDKPTGVLDYLGVENTGVKPGVVIAPTFIGNNVFAYLAGNDTCFYYTIYGFQRQSNGLLASANISYNLPAPPPQFTRYIPDLGAADPTNHVAFVMFPGEPPGCVNAPLQMASYTADANGNLTTTNTYSNMPATQIVSPYDMKMAPSGKLLALAGQEGLQIFHFNGAAPMTHFTGLLTTDPIRQMFWDNANHLYAISQSGNKLHVFTITPTAAHEAPGSPYIINSPWNIIVQPWPLPWA
jgi:hypothetical protein